MLPSLLYNDYCPESIKGMKGLHIFSQFRYASLKSPILVDSGDAEDKSNKEGDGIFIFEFKLPLSEKRPLNLSVNRIDKGEGIGAIFSN